MLGKNLVQGIILACLALGLTACDMDNPPTAPGGSGGDGDLVINEFVASNSASQMDEHGDFDDWMEIYNKGSVDVNLAGYLFSDDVENPAQYMIPVNAGAAADLPAGGFLLLWCDNQPEQGPLHANFKLSAGGEGVVISAPDGSLIEALTYGPQTTDIAYGRIPDGGTEWGFIQPTTGGLPNLGGGTTVPPIVSLVRLDPAFPDVGEAVTVTAVATDDNSVASVTLHYSVNGGADTEVAMTATRGSYEGIIPAQAAGANVTYYVVATDADGETGSLPRTAPEAVFNYIIPGGLAAPALFINEFIASNDLGAVDEAGESDDWLEIFNSTDSSVDIGGMYLTKDLGVPGMWMVPVDNAAATTIPAGGYLIIWCDEDIDQGTLHANFKLSRGGSDIGFYTSGGVEIDTLTYPEQTTDISQARIPDGSETWGYLNTPTPGSSNAALFINEFIASNDTGATDEAGDNDDWLEIFNAGETAVDLGGMYLTKDLTIPLMWMVPTDDSAATTVAAGGYLIIWCDDQVDQGTLHANFKLSRGGSDIGIFTANGAPVNSLTYPEQTTDISQARVPDGSDTWDYLATPTPGATNGTPGMGGW